MFYTLPVMRLKYLVILLIAMHFSPAFAIPVTGYSLSVAMETQMTKKGYATEKSPLAVTAQDDYPYNVLVFLSANKKAEPEAPEKTSHSSSDDIRNTVIISITQEDAYTHLDSVLSFIDNLKENPPVCNVILLLSAQEQSAVGANLSFTGSEIFARSFEDAERSAAVIVHFSDRKKISIHTGNIHRTAPLWLTRQIAQACSETHTDFSHADSYDSLYRLGLLRSDRRMNAFISNNIPAIKISFPQKADFLMLNYFLSHYRERGSQNWDSHYLFFRLFGKNVWIGEAFFFIITLTFGTLLLILLCTSSFKGKNGEDYKQDFIRSWIVIPITIGISFLSLLLGQKICQTIPLLSGASLIIQFGIKLLVTFFFNAVFFGIQQYLRMHTQQFTHGYFIYLVGLINVFVFSAVDLVFFITFMVEYLCIYVARRAVRIVPLILSVLLMLSPIIPYAYQLIRYGYASELVQLVHCTPLLNLLLAMLIFPYLIMWLRLLIRLRLYFEENQFSLKKIVINGSISTGAVVGILIIAITTLAILSDKIMQKEPQNAPEIISENKNTFFISASRTDFLGMTTQHVSIASKEDVLKYEAVISSGNSLPLYDSTYDYTINEEIKTAFFVIPDYPPRTITIDYATDSKDAANLFVTAWYATDKENVFRKETRGFMVSGEQ